MIGFGFNITNQRGVGGLLNTYSDATSAYSLRLLNTSYAGAVVRVRRSSDDAEQDFKSYEITDGTLATFTGANNGFVGTWYDQSGNANHATQTTLSAQPKIVNAGTVLDHLQFDGASNLSYTTSNPASISVLSVAKWDDATTGVICKGQTRSTAPNRDLDIFGNGSDINFYVEDTTDVVSAGSIAISTVPYYLLGIFHNSGSTPLYIVNDTDINGSTSIGDLDADNVNINIGGSLSSAFTFIGKVKEVIVYNNDQRALKNGFRANINGYYGIY